MDSNTQESQVRTATVGYLKILQQCNPDYFTDAFCDLWKAKTITSPSTPCHNENHDNCKYDYILTMDEVLGTGVPNALTYGKKQGSRYRVLGQLGQGAFGQVVKCFDEVNKTLVAIKVLKNKPAYYRQGMLEIAILQLLSEKFDADGSGNTLRMVDHFVFYNHICIVTELLSINLYELMKQNNCRALYVGLARSILQQLLEALVVCFKNGIVHCDLKPENVLLVDMTKKIKLIDFGSACFENSTLYSYIQSRHYRSPEVILGLPYSTAIDMWSFGCMAAELFVGIPIFPGNCEYNMLYKFINMIGMPPRSLLDRGTKTSKYFRRKRPAEMKNKDDVWAFKLKREFESDSNTYTEPNREYFSYKTLEDIAMKVNFRVSAADEPRKPEMRNAFLDFIKRALQWDPEMRMRPDQALQHPFITKKPFTVDYTLPPTNEPLRTFPPGTQLSPEEVLKKIAPNPAAAAKLKSMGYNATTYYQVYSDGLNKGVVLNILNSNPFYLQPMTPPSLIRLNQFEEEMLQKQRMRAQSENRGIMYQGLASAIHQNVVNSQIKFKTFNEIKKEKEENMARKQRRQTSDIFSTKAMEPLSPKSEEYLAQKMKNGGQPMEMSDIDEKKKQMEEDSAGSWSTNTGMLLPPGNWGTTSSDSDF
ncbi:serine/threonine protein kinase ppk15, putative [Entamoeba invadens IP1]|uniref:Serine/threonine protein kinase ppk15, putative n=1 Tax=Entamoeba invadens IP1 TaxID=370355 RepID=A0A0A1U5K1_ENTIV|nr:serine/threonine protein kinase ppk15, putative [Entamoeba invadens IP1]ELP88125.1 serine/threonine protein kinase ppk15, putative [Entamoeba invadens IP1]|eukprot:XP_004254896.1 serine/threonine protein kinase ppk15, putative [Entamoeba invadens IP1]